MQEKIEVLNERLEQTSAGAAGGKDESGDVVDGMQAWKQSVKKCEPAVIKIKAVVDYFGIYLGA